MKLTEKLIFLAAIGLVANIVTVVLTPPQAQVSSQPQVEVQGAKEVEEKPDYQEVSAAPEKSTSTTLLAKPELSPDCSLTENLCILAIDLDDPFFAQNPEKLSIARQLIPQTTIGTFSVYGKNAIGTLAPPNKTTPVAQQLAKAGIPFLHKSSGRRLTEPTAKPPKG